MIVQASHATGKPAIGMILNLMQIGIKIDYTASVAGVHELGIQKGFPLLR
jgi:hypothetical protein